MKTVIANPHSPEELARLSTAVHKAIGWLLLALSGVMLYEVMSGIPLSPWRLAWPALGAFIGFGLLLYILYHQVAYHRASPLAVPVQNMHMAIGLVVGVGAGLELLRRWQGSDSLMLGLAFPAALLGVGVLFLLHEQGTIEALLVHWALAGTLAGAGLGFAAVVLSGEPSKALKIFSAFLLAGAAVQLMVYAEDPGAHAGHEGGSTGSPPPTAPAEVRGHGDH